MKSIANQYRDLKEGRMSQANFMRNLRMMMPQHITNVTSFDDSVRILKNKGILTELGPAAMQTAGNPEEEASYKSALIKKKSSDEDAELEDLINKYSEEELGKYTKFQDVPGAISEDETNAKIEQSELTLLKRLYAKTPSEKIKKMIDDLEAKMSKDGSLNEAKKKKEPKQELHPNQIHPQELRMGIKVEMEHTDDVEKAKKIALDHLKENPFYYTALKLSGVDTKVEPTKQKEVKKKAEKQDLVDKENQMKPVPKKKIEEARLNIDGEPNEVVKKAMGYVSGPNANPTLKALSNEIEFQQTMDPNEALLRYDYWKELPEEAVEKLKLQFDVEVDRDADEDTGEIVVYRLTPKKTDKPEKYRAFQSKLEALVKEVMAEYFDGRDNLADEIAAEID